MDDYVLANRDLSAGFFETQAESYLHWSGRYFATAVSRLNPLLQGNFAAYKLYSFSALLLLITATLFFFHSLFGQLFSIKKIVSFSLFVITVYLLQLPDIAQGLYWFSSYMIYLGAIIYTLVFFGILLKLPHVRKKGARTFLQVAGFVLVIAIVGSNELSMIVLNATLLLILITEWQLYKKLLHYQVCLFLLSLLLGLVVVLAPGNYERMSSQASPGNVLFSFAGAGAMLVLNFMNWGFTMLLVSLIYILIWAAKFNNYSIRSDIFKASVPLSVAWYLGTIFILHFVFIYSTGQRAGSRVENVVYFLFVFGWLYLLQVGLNKYGQKLLPASNTGLNSFAFSLTIMFAILVLSLESNITTAYLDLFSGKAARFDQELKARYQFLRTSNCSTCPITPVTTLPKSLYIFSELRTDEVVEMGVNKEFATYWGKSNTYLTGPTPEVKDNFATLKDVGRRIQRQLFGMQE